MNQFQATRIEREDFRKLIDVINNCPEDNKLPEKTIQTVFDKWWPDLEKELNEINEEILEPDQPIRKDREILEEILQLIRKQGPGRGPRIFPMAINDLLEGYIDLHDQQMNNIGGYQETLDLLKKIHKPIKFIIDKSGRITNKNNELFDRFQNLSYIAINKEDNDEDESS